MSATVWTAKALQRDRDSSRGPPLRWLVGAGSARLMTLQSVWFAGAEALRAADWTGVPGKSPARASGRATPLAERNGGRETAAYVRLWQVRNLTTGRITLCVARGATVTPELWSDVYFR